MQATAQPNTESSYSSGTVEQKTDQVKEPARKGRDLIAATRKFAQESPLRSWWVLLSTTLVLGLAIAVAAYEPLHWTFRLSGSVIAGLTIVRFFILYHDFFHNAIFRGSKTAKWIFSAFGLLVLVPPRVWRETHNYHHAHTAKIVGSHVGSYPVVTTKMWKDMTKAQRLMYAAMRHPLTILFGYFTVFLLGMCISPLRRNFKRNISALYALIVHSTLLAILWYFAGALTMFLAYLLPLMISHMVGAYLFYAQHNFEEISIKGRHEWEFTHAALESSSYMECGPIMRWFTGDIGFHHVHHLNAMIPFYRLEETMNAIPELQNPHKTSLFPADIAACFKLKLWDEEREEMVPFSTE